MRIGDHNLTNDDEKEANKIITDFYSDIELPNESEEDKSDDPIIEEGEAYGVGRSVQEDKQYRLKISNQTYSGIKLHYSPQTHLEVEFIVTEVREKLGMLGYKIQQIKGFPMNGDKWRKTDCMISYWGPVNQRLDLETITPSQIQESDRIVFLEEIASNAAFSYALGLWDRDNRNFVWDSKEKKIISIDHEDITKEIVDMLITNRISNVMTKFFGVNWFDNKELKEFIYQCI